MDSEPATGLTLDADVRAALAGLLPGIARQAVVVIAAEVPDYADALSGPRADTIEGAVQTALGAFLRLVGQPAGADPAALLHPALEGAYALGRGEARSGRSMDALLAAYRVGARLSWRELSTGAVDRGLPARDVALLAERVFAYIDELSAASVAGHTDELATSGRLRERYRHELAAALVAGAAPDGLELRAARAEWAPPTTLTAVLLPSALVRTVTSLLDPRTLLLPGDAAGLDSSAGGAGAEEPSTVLLVPDASRPGLLQTLRGRPAVVGPARAWVQADRSLARAVRAAALLTPTGGPVDTDDHLAALVLSADADALADLRSRALAPLAGLRPSTADRLAETLRSWLLHQGRREEVAAELQVHAQTVRYRMTQVRQLWGDRLHEPAVVLELTVALALHP